MQHESQEYENQINKNSNYDELKMAGPPLYSQGDIRMEGKIFNVGKCDPPSIDASRTALVVVDVQPEYWSECPAVRQDFPYFPSRIANLIDHCRSQNAKCIWVRADYSFEKSPWLVQFSRLHQGRIPPVVKPSSKWESFAEPHSDETLITKTSWSSTSDTKLIDVLKESGIETVLVCGLITSVCVQHSAFGLFEAGFRTILVTDACADRGKARHEAALALYGDYMYELRTTNSVSKELVMRPEHGSQVGQQYYMVTKTAGSSAMSAASSSSSSSTSLSSMVSASDEVYCYSSEEMPTEELPSPLGVL